MIAQASKRDEQSVLAGFTRKKSMDLGFGVKRQMWGYAARRYGKAERSEELLGGG